MVSSAAVAQDLPALFFVTGVASDDVLTVREHPGHESAGIATIPPDRRNLEVLRFSDDMGWAKVGLGEQGGWVAARYLSPEDTRDPALLPVPMRCFGSEPFWGFWVPTHDFAEFEQLPHPERSFEVEYQGLPQGGATSDLVATFSGQDATGTLLIRREHCAGTMADREFGISARLVLILNGATVYHAGCCSLTGH